MAFSVTDNLAFTGTGTASSVHLNVVANGSASFVGVAVNNSASGRLSPVTDSAGNGYTLAGTYPGTNIEIELWYSLNCTLTNTTTVTVTPTNSGDVWAACWAVISGVAANSAFDRKIGQAGTSNSTDSAITPTTAQPNEILIGLSGQSNNRPYSAGAGFTSINQAANSTSAEVFMEFKIVSAMGQYNSTSSFDLSNNWVQGTFTFADTPLREGGVGNAIRYIEVGDGMSRSEGAN